jgi:hypothetical protein
MQVGRKLGIYGVFGAVFLLLGVPVALMRSSPAGYYDLVNRDGGWAEWFGGATTTVRFSGGQVLTVYASARGGSYLKTNGCWTWVLSPGRELRIRPGIFGLKCWDPGNPTNAVTFRRVLPSKMGSP